MRYRSIMLLIFVVMFTSCSLSGPTCSGANVTNLVKQLAARKMMANQTLAGLYDLETSAYDVRGIRTTSSDSNSCECVAQLHADFRYLPNIKALKEGKTVEGFNEHAKSYVDMFKDNGDFDISYDAQDTDDRKDVYVSLIMDGFDQP